ncbi:replicative DNA helicase [Entomoplasma freundtii]|uniref:Replicative DNA helicase n=1 Tax=Entomoplasma freundtii TaxID=74700 RepID=A0A2K8NSH4_9MOLU|nr:replicative DNA helicase [Entomoplasma freundtii]ATZ16704.1 replicative DNA helicase [Entomoplasma freundtii]TDY58129.1 replicative DNA helicase [Entomoplasma freundtii]
MANGNLAGVSNWNNDQAILVEAEQKLLGIALHSPNALPEILSALSQDDFFLGTHKLIFGAICNLNQTGKAVISTTVIDALENEQKLKAAGGVETVTALSETYYGDEALETLIDIVFQKAMGRKFDQTLKEISQLRQSNNDLATVLNTAQNELLKIDLDYKQDEVQSIGTTIKSLVTKLQQLERNPHATTGVPSGFNRLDKITSGFQKGDLVILAARPSMGKTAFALNLAFNAANYKNSSQQPHNSIAIFSIEMPKEQLTQRLVAMMTQIDAVKLRTGQNLTTDDWRKIRKAEDQLQDTKIFIDDTPGLTVQQLQARLHKLKRDSKINFCIVDYLQLISTPGSSGENRQNEIANISRQLKRIARDLEVPIICLSQLSRSVEKREDRRPMMSDLRDSGAIEQDADLIMFLYRESYYERKDKLGNQNLEPNPVQETELIISKHRNGSTGTVKLSFNLEYGKFLDLAN